MQVHKESTKVEIWEGTASSPDLRPLSHIPGNSKGYSALVVFIFIWWF